jgi:hypothetical protein
MCPHGTLRRRQGRVEKEGNVVTAARVPPVSLVRGYARDGVHRSLLEL